MQRCPPSFIWCRLDCNLSPTFLLLLHVTPLTLSDSHLSFLILSKGGTTENMFTILSNVGCIACLLLFHTHTACLGLTCFSFICWPGFTLFSCSLTQLFLLVLAHLSFSLQEEQFGMTATILWYRLQCLHLSLSLWSHSCSKSSFSLSPVFLTFTSLFHFPSQENRQGIHQPSYYLDGGVLSL